MTILKKSLALFLVLLMLPLGLTAQASQVDTDHLVRRLINYFHHYQEDARLDCDLILEQIAAEDPELAATWTNILDFWTGVNGDMEFHSDVLPDGLPDDDSLCIVVMGYYLKSDGSMRDELYQRMQVTLASANKYPNAYILCTGGGTASESNRATEAGQMAKWLKKKGVDPDRIIVETQAMSTIQNATYGCALLYQDYPQIKNLAIITSDYHIYRSCLYFHVQAALDAYEAGVEPMRVISNASCRINPGASKDLDRQVEGVGMLTDLDVVDMKREALTQLEKISIAGQFEYAPDSQLNLTVTAHYSNGYTRNVTQEAELSGFDMETPGFHSVTVCYDEMTETFDIYVIAPQTEPAPTVPVIPTDPEPTAPEISEEPETTEETDYSIVIAAAVLVLLAIILLLLKGKQAKKRRRRPRPTIKLD